MNAGALLDAILSDPFDITSRLVYADWLNDHGEDDQAEFIRLQIERAGLHPSDPRVRQCFVREKELLAAYDYHWSAQIRPFAQRYRFSRGFIEEITIEAEVFLLKAKDLYRAAPIRAVNLVALDRLLEQLRRNGRLINDLSEALQRIESLRIRGFVQEEATLFDQLRSTEALPRLKTLDYDFAGRVRSEQLSVLANAEILGRLESLTLNVYNSQEALEAMLSSPRLRRLEHLTIHRAPDSSIVQLLLGSSLLPGLRSLLLSHNPINSESVRALVNSPQAARLQHLELAFTDVGVSGLRDILRSPFLTELRQLNLSRTGVGSEGAQLLAESPLLGQLRGIDLSMNQIDDAGGRALANYSHENRLGTLDLIYNHLRNPTRQALVRRFGKEVCLFRR